MGTEVISAQDPRALAQALQVLRSGGLVAFPTDTVYGLGVDVYNPAAVRRLYKAKGRASEKAIPVLISTASELSRVALQLSSAAQRLASHFWPGPLTLIVWRRSDLPAEISAEPTIGVRMPDHPLALALLTIAGPLAVTSANISGHPDARSAAEVLADIGGKFELLLDGGVTKGGSPSTIVDCTKAMPLIIREGPISEEDILTVVMGSDSRKDSHHTLS